MSRAVVETIAELKALRVDDANGVVRWLVPRRAWYYPDVNSTAIDDNDSVITPNLGVGRWRKQEALQVTTFDLSPEDVNANFTGASGKRYFLDCTNIVTTVECTLPVSPPNGTVFEIVPYNVTFGKILIFRGSGSIKINDTTNDYTATLYLNLVYKVIYINSSAGWLITLSDRYTKLNPILRGSNTTIIARTWDDTQPYDYTSGCYDLVGKNFITNANYTITSIPEVSWGNSWSNLGATNNQASNKNLIFNRTSDNVGDQQTNSWRSSTGILLKVISIGNQSNLVRTIPDYLINPTSILLIFSNGNSSNNPDSWKAPVDLVAQSNFRACVQNFILTGYTINTTVGISNLVGEDNNDLIQRSDIQDVLYSNKNSSDSNTNFDNNNIKVVSHTQLPAPYNTPRHIGVRVNVIFNKSRYYNAFSINVQGNFPVGFANSPPSFYTTNNNSSNTNMILAFFEVFGNIYKLV